MPTVIYCAKSKRKQAKQQLDLEYNHVFASPNSTDINHTATRVVIVGNHSHIAERYKGIAEVEYLELESDADEEE